MTELAVEEHVLVVGVMGLPLDHSAAALLVDVEDLVEPLRFGKEEVAAVEKISDVAIPLFDFRRQVLVVGLPNVGVEKVLAVALPSVSVASKEVMEAEKILPEQRGDGHGLDELAMRGSDGGDDGQVLLCDGDGDASAL